MCCSWPASATAASDAESDRFAALLRENLAAYAHLAGAAAAPRAAAHFARRELADRRRRGGGLPQLRVLLGSRGDDGAARVHWIDETGAAAELPYAAHGVGAALVLGHLDGAYDADMSRDAAVDRRDERPPFRSSRSTSDKSISSRWPVLCQRTSTTSSPGFVARSTFATCLLLPTRTVSSTARSGVTASSPPSSSSSSSSRGGGARR